MWGERMLMILLSLWALAGAALGGEAAPPRALIPASEEPLVLAGSPSLVVLTREQLDELLSGAVKEPAPVRPVVMQSARFEAFADDAAMKLTATLKARVFARWAYADVTLKGAAIAEATADGAPAALYWDGNRLFVRLEQGEHEIHLTAIAPVSALAGSRRVALALPRAAAVEFTAAIAGKVAAESDRPVESRYDEGAKTTRVSVVPAGDAPFRLAWSEPSEAGERTGALNSFSVSSVLADTKLLAISSTVTADIQLAPLEGLAIALPENFQLEKVSCDRMKKYRVEGDGRRLAIDFVKPVAGTVTVQIEGQIGARAEGPTRIHPLYVEGGWETWGSMQIAAAPGLRLQVAGEHHARSSEIKPRSASFALEGADAWVETIARAAPARLAVSMEAGMAISEGQTLLAAEMKFRVVDGSIWRITVKAPAQYALVEESISTGSATQFAESVAGTTRSITWPLAAPLGPGGQGVVRMLLNLPGANAGRVSGSLELPRLEMEGAEQFEGRYAIACDPAYRVHILGTQWARPVPHKALLDEGRLPADTQALLNIEAPDYFARFNLVAQAPVVSARGDYRVDIFRHSLIETAELTYSIENGPTDRLRLSLPVREGTQPRITVNASTVGVEKTETREGREYWEARLARPLLGEVIVTVTAEHTLASERTELAINPPRTEGTVRENGAVKVTTEGAVEAAVETQGLNREDIPEDKQLIEGGRRVIEAYRYGAHPWTLKVAAVRFARAELLSTMVEGVGASVMIDGEGNALVEETMRVNSKQSQTVRVRLPAGAKLWSVLVDEKPARASLAGDVVTVSLPGSGADWGANTLRVVHYSKRPKPQGISGMELPLARLEGQMPVGKTRTDLYLARALEVGWSSWPLQRETGQNPMLRTDGLLSALSVSIEWPGWLILVAPAGIVLLILYARLHRRKEWEESRKISPVWAVVVLVVGVLLAGLLLPSLARVREGARKTQSKANLRQIGFGLTIFAQEHEGFGPASLQELDAQGYLSKYGAGSEILNAPNIDPPYSAYIYSEDFAKRKMKITDAGLIPIVWENPGKLNNEEGYLNVLYTDGSARGVGISPRDLVPPYPGATQWPGLVAALQSSYQQDEEDGMELAAGRSYERQAQVALPKSQMELGQKDKEAAEKRGERQRALGDRLTRASQGGPAQNAAQQLEMDQSVLPATIPQELFQSASLARRADQGKLSMPLDVERTGTHYWAENTSGTGALRVMIVPLNVMVLCAWAALLAVLFGGLALGRARAAIRWGGVVTATAGLFAAAVLLGGVFVPAANGALAGAVALAAWAAVASGARRLRWRNAPKAAAAAVVLAAFAAALLAPANAGAAGDSVNELVERLTERRPVTLRDDTIYIPYEIAPNGRIAAQERYYLAEKLYKELTRRRIESLREPGAGWLFAGADYRATLAEGRVHLEGKLTVASYARGAEAPIRIGGAGIESLEATGPDGASAVVRPDGTLVMANPGRYTVRFKAALAGKARAEAGSLEVELPPVNASRFELALAATEKRLDFQIIGPSSGYEVTRTAAGTTLVCAPASGGRLHIDWQPRVQVAQEKTFLTARTRSLVFAGAETTATFSRVEATLSLGAASRLAFDLSADAAVLKVFSSDLKSWRVTSDAEGRSLELVYNNAWSGAKTVLIEVSRRNAQGKALNAAADAPALRGAGAGEGTLVVAILPTVEGAIDAVENARMTGRDAGDIRNGWEGLEAGQYEAWLFSQLERSRAFAFELAEKRPTITVAVRRAQPKLSVSVKTDITAEIDALKLSCEVTGKREGAGNFTLAIALPEDMRVDDLEGKNVAAWDMDSATRRLVVYFAQGAQEQTLRLRGRVARAKDEMKLPVIGAPEAEQLRAQVRLRAAPGVELAVADVKNMTAAAGGEDQWSFNYRAEKADYGATLRLKNLAAQVLAETWLKVDVQDAAYTWEARTTFQVELAPVERVAFSVPERLAATGLSVTGPVRETVRYPDRGRVVYEAILERPMMGSFTVTLKTSDALEGDKLEVPAISVEGAQRSPVHVALAKSAAAQVETEAVENLTSVDRREEKAMPEWIEADKVVALYAGQGAWSMRLKLERYVKEKGLEIFVPRASYITALDGTLAVTQATFEIFNRTAQSAKVTLPKGAALWLASVKGQAVDAAHAGEDSYYVPLLRAAGAQSRFYLELVYAQRVPAGKWTDLGRAALSDLKVSETQWTVSVPKGFRAAIDTNMRRAKTRGGWSFAAEARGDTVGMGSLADVKIRESGKPILLAGGGEQVQGRNREATMDQKGFVDWYSNQMKQVKKQEAPAAQQPAAADAAAAGKPPEGKLRPILLALGVDGDSYRYDLSGEQARMSVALAKKRPWAQYLWGAVALAIAGLGIFAAAKKDFSAIGFIERYYRLVGLATVAALLMGLAAVFAALFAVFCVGWVRNVKRRRRTESAGTA